MIFEKWLDELYFEWITSIVIPDKNIKHSYYKLLELLHNIDYEYSNPLDQNRESDGKDLRYHFAYRAKLPESVIQENLVKRNGCSVLEMLIALSFKIEEEIMYDPTKGDRTSEWFGLMLYNLGLTEFSDQNWIYGITDNNVYSIVKRFLDNDIDPYGNGGLFIFKKPKTDGSIRSADIWTQANWYISETYI